MQKNHTILLVDDDPDDQFLFREALEYADDQADFLIASNGEQALALLEKQEILPDLVFLDLNMPVMDGGQCLKAVRKNVLWKKLPIVIYSTTISTGHAKELSNFGATAILQKPHDFMALCTMIQDYIMKLDNRLL